ncbi:hypothetical protein [Ekhidna sp. To15]|uniref:hypothetical protein n=1 Tax=Ekhidna sp. To15 TaxID=3395267 RepID=UPI003F52586A
MKKLIYFTLVILSYSTFSQQSPNIVKVIDALTVQWDETAIALKDYQGIQNFCTSETNRKKTIKLLDQIHHWDTTLYFTVQSKYEGTQDAEAEATLKDIEKLETEYSTQNFKTFILDECTMLKEIDDSFDKQTVKQYEKEIKKFEKELVKYLNSITYRIDIIDEHIHHLKLD